MIELLAPAGTKEKLITAFNYGADACYFAGTKYGLRAYSGNFNNDELRESIEYAHRLGKKCYITVNIVAHNKDFNGLKEYILYLESIKADAVIVSDVGIIKLIREVAPNLAIHISNQANVTNKYAAKFYCDLGVTRIVLARELSLEEIKEIRDFIPKEVELEAFVHGAMCISYSGRCLLSNFLTGRDGNCGACVQACRWEYAISEINRPNEKLPITEDEHGTYILNSKDINMLQHLKELYDAGVTSFKVEGRMKSAYYVATVINAYRRVIDNKFKVTNQLIEELNKTSHRKYTTAFYFGDENKEDLTSSGYSQTHEFMAIVLEDSKNGVALIEQRNRFKVGDTLEVLSPTKSFNKKIKVEAMLDEKNKVVEDALKVQQKLYLKTSVTLTKGDILRRKI